MTTETFRFSYTVFTAEATLDENQLIVKTGMRTVVAPVARLQHLHVKALSGSDHSELLISQLLPSGKLKRSRVHSDKGEPGFDALVAALLARRPEIDIRGVSADEAYRQTGAKPMPALAVPGVMALGWLIIALAFLPMIIHGFDGGQTETDVAGLAGELSSRNVTVVGRVVLASALHAPSETDKRLGTTSVWMPLVSQSWTDGKPVSAILEIRGIRPDALIEMSEHTRFDGIVRDIGWEGLRVKTREAITEAGTALAPDVKLVQYKGDRRQDLTIAGGVLGFLGLLVLGAWLKLRRPSLA